MEVLALVIGALIGITVGIVITMGRMRRGIEDASVGYLRIDRSEPDEPARPFLEIEHGSIESISKKKFVILKIVNENYLSRD